MTYRPLLLLATLLALLPACRPRPVPEQESTYRVELSEAGLLSVTATATPVSRILEQLRTSYGIVVEIPDFQERSVTDRFAGLPLDSAIRRLVPNSRPHIVVVGRDRMLPADTGDKPGRRTSRPTGLPRKDTVAVVPLIDSLRPKPRPDTTARPERPSGVALKPEPRDTAQPDRVEPKRPARAVQDSARHLWASLVITANGRLSVEVARVLAGPRVVSAVPEGTYYYVVTAAGRPVAVGSFPDPFEQRAYARDPRAPHEVTRADTGRFVLTAPWDALANVEPAQIGVQVLRLRPGASPPAVELQRAPELTRSLEPVATLAPGAIAEALRRATPPRD